MQTVQIANTPSVLEQIFRFRYKIYIEELDKNHLEADHEQQMLFDVDDFRSLITYVSDGDTIVGSLRCQTSFEVRHLEKMQIVNLLPYINLENITIVGRLMVSADRRGQIIGFQLMNHIYNYGIIHDCHLCFIEIAPDILNIYQRLGFRQYNISYLENGQERIQMVLVLRDKAYLQSIGSPFVKSLPDELDDKGANARLLAKVFPLFQTGKQEILNS